MERELAVVGLGYVGLPLAQQATRAGLPCVGFDVSADVVTRLNAGRSHVDDLSDADVAEMLAGGFAATTDADGARRGARPSVICVPTPLSDEGGPDLSAVDRRDRRRRPHLGRGTLVVLESTTYPGTTEDGRPAAPGGGVRAGRRRGLPPGVLPGADRPGQRAVTGSPTPRRSSAAAPGVHGRGRGVLRPVRRAPWSRARGTREAETAKLLENTYRHVNIALVNEMARFCHELGHRPVGRDPAGVAPSRSASSRSTRAGRRRALHPDRPELPVPQRARPSSATRSGSSSWPRRSTRRCRPTSPTARRTL